MTHAEQNAMVYFAARHGITPMQAVALPAIFENASKKTGLSVRSLLRDATYTNMALGRYLADIARRMAQ